MLYWIVYHLDLGRLGPKVLDLAVKRWLKRANELGVEPRRAPAALRSADRAASPAELRRRRADVRHAPAAPFLIFLRDRVRLQGRLRTSTMADAPTLDRHAPQGDHRRMAGRCADECRGRRLQSEARRRDRERARLSLRPSRRGGNHRIRRRRGSARRSREGAQASQARRDRRSRRRRRRRQHPHRRGVLAGTSSTARGACRSARSIISPRISGSPCRSMRRPGRSPPGMSASVDLAEVNGDTLHQQFLDRHLSLHGHRPGAAERKPQARQMDGDGAGLLPHAAAFPAAATAHQGARLCHPLPHALRVRRQQRIRHRAVHLRQAQAPRSRRALVLRGEAAQSRSNSC